jgi:hypothetical protein
MGPARTGPINESRTCVQQSFEGGAQLQPPSPLPARTRLADVAFSVSFRSALLEASMGLEALLLEVHDVSLSGP